MEKIKELIELYIEQNAFGITGVIVELVLGLVLILVLSILIMKKSKKKNIFFISAIVYILAVFTCILNLNIVTTILYIVVPAYFVIANIERTNDARHIIRDVNMKPQKGAVINTDAKTKLIDELCSAVDYLSGKKIGALITIEKQMNVEHAISQAVAMDAQVTKELLETIFYKGTALHDGAVIIRENRIAFAAAIFRVAERPDIAQSYGTRHRAAIGVSEDTDAFTIVVSEETGIVSTTLGGTITSNIGLEVLKQSLNEHIIIKEA